MISCDTNVLYAACDTDNRRHVQACAFFRQHAGDSSFVLCEQVLMELYCLLRNPVVSHPALRAVEAQAVVARFRKNPAWRLVDVPCEHRLMDEVWAISGKGDFAYRRIFDVRLALTLRHHGVTDFATCDMRGFADLGFRRVWDPLL